MADIVKRNYIKGDYEAITDQDIGSFVLNTWSYIKLDGYFKFLFSDVVVKKASDSSVIPATEYELLQDDRYTNEEAEAGGSSKTVYAQVKITNATYAGIDLLISCNNFGSYTDNEVVGSFLPETYTGITSDPGHGNSDLSIINTYVGVDTSGGAFNYTLPSAGSGNTGRTVHIQIETAGNDLTILGHGLGYTLKLEGDAGSYATLRSNGSVWKLIDCIDFGEVSNIHFRKTGDGTVTHRSVVTTDGSGFALNNTFTITHVGDLPRINANVNDTTSVTGIFVSIYGITLTDFDVYTQSHSGAASSGRIVGWRSEGRWRT